jgi:hypothetical protein
VISELSVFQTGIGLGRFYGPVGKHFDGIPELVRGEYRPEYRHYNPAVPCREAHQITKAEAPKSEKCRIFGAFRTMSDLAIA